MGNLAEGRVPQLDGVTFRPVSLAIAMHARQMAQESQEQDRAHVFTDIVLSSMFVEPRMTPEDMADLDIVTLGALVDRAVDDLHICDQFSECAADLPVQERFYLAYLKAERELLEPLSAIAAEIVERANQAIAQAVAPWLQRVDKTVVSLGSSVQQQIVKLGEVTSRLAAAMEPVVRSAVQVTSQALGIFDGLIQLIEAQEGAAEAFNAAGWPIAPSMPSELRERVVRMHKEGKTRYMSSAVMGYYRRHGHQHLIEAVESWQSHPLFAPRMHVIKDALSAHCEGKYTLTVPALVSQIEGILSQYVVDNQLNARLSKPYSVSEAVIGPPEFHSLRTYVIAATLRFQLENNLYGFTDFRAELEKSSRARAVTRHTIYHGIAYNYDKPIHSLKCFVLLDAVSALSGTSRDA